MLCHSRSRSYLLLEFDQISKASSSLNVFKSSWRFLSLYSLKVFVYHFQKCFITITNLVSFTFFISNIHLWVLCMMYDHELPFFFGQNVMGLHLVKPSPFVLCQQFPPFMQSFYDSSYIFQGHCFFLLYFLLMFLFQYSCIQGKKN